MEGIREMDEKPSDSTLDDAPQMQQETRDEMLSRHK